MSEQKKTNIVSNPFGKSTKKKKYIEENDVNEEEDKQELLNKNSQSQQYQSEPTNDFFKSQMNKAGISEDTLKFGLNIGKQMVKDSKFIDYFSLTILKPYFEIDNQYVINKLKTLFIPFIYYFRKNQFETEEIPSENSLKLSPEYPDLYLPTMSFITYILLIGFYSASLSEQLFDPQILGRIASKNFFLSFLQVFVCKLILFIFSSSKISFIDCLCYSGYKFTYLIFVPDSPRNSRAGTSS